MNSELAWVLVSSGAQVQPQIILDSDYLPDYLSVSYEYGFLYLFFLHVLGEFETASQIRYFFSQVL